MFAGKSSSDSNARRRANQTTQRRADYQRLEDRAMLAAFVPGEVLVQYEWGHAEAGRLATRHALGAQLAETIHTVTMRAAGTGPLELLRLPAGMSVAAAIREIANRPGVVFAEPNYVYEHTAVSNDTRYTNGSLWGMYSDDVPTPVGPTGTTNVYGTQAEKAWNAEFLGSHSIVVGVIDEGIQVTHPDLAANIWVNPFDPVDGIDNDGNGYIDDIHGWDFYNNNNTVYDGTSDDHGTHVAGTIGAVGGNGTGVVGVNWNVTMVSLKFLGSGGGSTANAIKAIDYLTDLKTRHGMNVVASNNSWGGGGFSSSLLAAIARGADQGIMFVAAAGNSGANNDSSNFYPANYNTTASSGWDAVISVANINSNGNKSTSSNYGATTVDLGAPGSSIWSTVPSNSYASYSGTSMAAPHVTGALALYRAAMPNATGPETRNAILQNTTATSSLSGITVTGGRLDAWKIMQTVSQNPDISISDVAQAEGDSGTTVMNFVVSLSSSPAAAVTVNYATADGTATAGSDYEATSGTLTFNAGETSKMISVTIFGDTDFEADETFFVDLSQASGGNLVDAQALGTILNDDAIIPDITITDVTANEGSSGTTKNFTFKVRLSEATTKTVKISYATADGTALAGEDYTAKSGTITFNPGITSKNLVVVVNADTTIEPDETFFVNLFTPVNANLVDAQGVGTILNDDIIPPDIWITNVSANEGNSDSKKFTFKVKLSEAATQTVKVSYATADGTATANEDYQPKSGTISFKPGIVTKNLVIMVYGDTTPEFDETFFVNLFNPVNGVIIDDQGQGTIKNDDGSPSPIAPLGGPEAPVGGAGPNPMAFVGWDDPYVSQSTSRRWHSPIEVSGVAGGVPTDRLGGVAVLPIRRSWHERPAGAKRLLTVDRAATGVALLDREFAQWDDLALSAL